MHWVNRYDFKSYSCYFGICDFLCTAQFLLIHEYDSLVNVEKCLLQSSSESHTSQ